MRNKILIIGASRLGTGIATLQSEAGENVMIIDKTQKAFDKLPTTYTGFTIVGDATDLTVLEANFIESTKQVVIATDDDNANLFIALVCKKLFKVPEVFVRLLDPDKNMLIKDTDIKPLYPFELVIDSYVSKGGYKK